MFFQLGSDSKAVGGNLGYEYHQSGAAENQLAVPAGPGGVSPGADGLRHEKTDPVHNSSLSPECAGPQDSQMPDGGSPTQGTDGSVVECVK